MIVNLVWKLQSEEEAMCTNHSPLEDAFIGSSSALITFQGLPALPACLANNIKDTRAFPVNQLYYSEVR